MGIIVFAKNLGTPRALRNRYKMVTDALQCHHPRIAKTLRSRLEFSPPVGADASQDDTKHPAIVEGVFSLAENQPFSCP